ncbi:hypothetical protein ACJX0J_033531, partial [Zea mays]
ARDFLPTFVYTTFAWQGDNHVRDIYIPIVGLLGLYDVSICQGQMLQTNSPNIIKIWSIIFFFSYLSNNLFLSTTLAYFRSIFDQCLPQVINDFHHKSLPQIINDFHHKSALGPGRGQQMELLN